MGRLDATYARLPVPLQNAGVTAYGMYWRWLRFGPGYDDYVREFEARDRFTAVEWAEWTDQSLRSYLGAAAEVPYYARSWSAAERRAARAGRLADLPLLAKEPLRADPYDFVDQHAPRQRRYVFHTSGSTGTPIATIWNAQEMRRSLAVREVRSARWAGTSFRLPRATFSGRMVVPDPHSAGPFHRFNRMERQAYLSPFHLRAETAPAYVDALRRHGIEWLTGYAVSYYLLARFILEQKLEVPPLRSIVTTSEKLTSKMRAVMTEAFRCPVFEEYSTVENALFASECEHGRLHVSPDVGIVEIIRPDGTPCAAEEPGEVVATCLMRGLQPLVRYRLGDQAMWSGDECPCGRSLPVLKEVLGRIEDVVIGPDGRQMVRFHGIFVNQPYLREGQIIQERLDRIRVRIVPASGYGAADEQDIIRRVRQRLGAGTEIVVETVDEIPRSASGKFQPVISLLRDQGVAAVERTGAA